MYNKLYAHDQRGFLAGCAGPAAVSGGRPSRHAAPRTGPGSCFPTKPKIESFLRTDLPEIRAGMLTSRTPTTRVDGTRAPFARTAGREPLIMQVCTENVRGDGCGRGEGPRRRRGARSPRRRPATRSQSRRGRKGAVQGAAREGGGLQRPCPMRRTGAAGGSGPPGLAGDDVESAWAAGRAERPSVGQAALRRAGRSLRPIVGRGEICGRAAGAGVAVAPPVRPGLPVRGILLARPAGRGLHRRGAGQGKICHAACRGRAPSGSLPDGPEPARGSASPGSGQRLPTAHCRRRATRAVGPWLWRAARRGRRSRVCVAGSETSRVYETRLRVA